MKTKLVVSQPSWVLQNDQISLAVTEIGGQMAPVTFFRNGHQSVQPYYISPWQGENLKIETPVLTPLRGDFFCMPFGADSTYRGTAHTTHGESATGRWRFADVEKRGETLTLVLTMKTRKLKGSVTKRVSLVSGHNAVYLSHLLEGYTCRTTLGHHATLAPPDQENSMRISTSPIQFGMVGASPPGYTADREYCSLLGMASFKRLQRVPTIWRADPYADCTRFPARRGFVDIVQVHTRLKAGSRPRPAWTVAAVPSRGYLWYSLKDPTVLPSTVMWMENHGRHGSPWNGRNLCIGLEEVCALFADGLTPSLKANVVSAQGIPTAVKLTAARPKAVNCIHGVVRIPRAFDRVKTIRFKPGVAEFVSDSGKSVQTRVDHEFVFSGVT